MLSRLGIVLILVVGALACLALGPKRRGPGLNDVPDCSRSSGALPNPSVAAGTPDSSNPIEHVVVVMQENNSFDHYFGRLNVAGYEGQVDGITPEHSNPDAHGKNVFAFHEDKMCVIDLGHNWKAMHDTWDGGKNDKFAQLNGHRSLGYYEAADLPYYYALANQFAIGDRYFCSSLTQTYPNRFFLLAATAFGHVKNDTPKTSDEFSQKTIFDTLDQYGVSWKYYTDSPGYLSLFHPLKAKDHAKFAKIDEYRTDLNAGKLPSVVFLDSDWEDGEDEHPDADTRVGMSWVAARINELMQSPAWATSALFLTYDEAGGFSDHVAPPAACKPDEIAPNIPQGWPAGAYDRLGFRVPFVAVSPYARHHYVSHVTYDHTSILRFIENKWNLPALTRRDANAEGLIDLFDFKHPDLTVPSLPEATRPTTKCLPDAS